MKKPPLEKTVRKKIVAEIESRGGFATKIHVSPYQEAGIPDLLCCYRGIFVAIETKRSADEEATTMQKYQMKRIRRAGGYTLLTHTVEAVRELLDRIDEGQEARPRNQ